LLGKKQVKESLHLSDVESILQNFPTKKTPGPDGFAGESYPTVLEETVWILQRLKRHHSSL
jgi:hypothetical protein